MANNWSGKGLTIGGSLTNFPPGGDVTPPFYADFLRDNLYPNLYFRQLGTQVTIRRGYGDKIKIPRWDSPVDVNSGTAGLVNSATAITETITAGKVIETFALSSQSITGQTRQFAGARAYSDKLVLTIMANWVEGALESLGREMTFRLDRFSRKGITANSFLKTADGTSTISAAEAVTRQLNGKTIARIAPIMDARHVPRWEDESFIMMTNPLAQFDIYRDSSSTGFVSVARYNDAGRIYRGEIGNQYGVRMLLSTNIPLTFAGGDQGAVSAKGFNSAATGAAALVFGPDAFYCIEQEGGGVEVIHHPLGSSGSVSDPANQRGSVAVKVHYGVVAAPLADSRLMMFTHQISLNS